MSSPDFVARVSKFPLVNTALRAYEHGKASSRVVKYGAEMMESSVKTISRPVIDRLPVDVNQLDEFACRQLDKLDRYRHLSGTDLERMQVDETSRERIIGEGQTSLDYFSSRQAHEGTDPQPSRRSSPVLPDSSDNKTPAPQNQNTAPADLQGQAVAQRSHWQAVLLEAGGISAAVSEESMRRLKYCLQWLQYATLHIDAQILILRDFIDSLHPSDSSSGTDTLISPTHMRTLTDVRRDIVQTIRQVVDIVSKYAGGALPEPARSRVRGFILHLPQRWATASVNPAPGMADGAPGSSSAVGAAAGGAGSTRRTRTTRYHKERSAGGPDRSQACTPASSRASSPLASTRVGLRPTTSAATQAAQRVLALATESLDMMRGVTGVVKDSLDRADAWVERLRVIGLQRQQSHEDSEPFDGPASSPFAQHRRQNSIPGLSSTPSTPFSSIPSTPAANYSAPATPVAYSSTDTLGMGLRLGEASARTSLSELQLDGETYETARSVPKDLCEGEPQRRKPDRIWERQSPDNTSPSKDGMIVDDV